MVKRRGRKKKASNWLYPILWGVLALLVLLLVYPSDSEHVAVQKPQTPTLKASVYEDTEVTPVTIEPKPNEVVDSNVKEQRSIAIEKKILPQQVQKGLALVIDDVGYDLPALRRILALPFPVAISIIPDTPYAREAAEMAHKAHQTVMLHMPMEPANPHYRARMDDSFLRAGMKRDKIYAMLQHGLQKVPYAQGMNNHMGSLLTAMPEPMAWVMQFCQDNGLFFLDSKTSAKSVASDVAKSYGLVWGARRVFLDNSINQADIEKAWHLAHLCAQRSAGCIIIGHPHSETLKFLESGVTTEEIKRMRDIHTLLHTPKAS